MPKASKPESILDPTRTGVEAEKLNEYLRSNIIGQPEAIDEIIRVYQVYAAGLNDATRPLASFLFLGPTGTGKTRTVEATAEALTGSTQYLIKIDCGGFQHSHEIAKLTGSPPGYLGHKETVGMLNAKYFNPSGITFVLFDEIEKANQAFWDILLGILDKAVLTLGDNSKTNFSRSIIFMTGNLGAREIQALSTPWGFYPPNNASQSKIGKVAIGAASRRFRPEFMNRLDSVCVFKSLTTEDLKSILQVELKSLLSALPYPQLRSCCSCLNPLRALSLKTAMIQSMVLDT